MRSLRSRAWLRTELALRYIYSFLQFPSFLFGGSPCRVALLRGCARAPPEASPPGSIVGAPRGCAFSLLGRFLSSAAARARAFGLPSPLNVHRFFHRQGASAWWRTVGDGLASSPRPPLARP